MPSQCKNRVLVALRHPVGGIRTYVHYHYPYLIDAGYQFTFVGPDGPDFARFSDDVRAWPDVEVIPAPARGRKVALQSTVRRQLRTRRFGLLHSHGITAGVHSVMANVGVGIPHVLTSHDVFLPRHFSGWSGQLKRQLLERLLLRVDVLVTVSEGALENHRAYLPRLRGVPDKLIAIRNGIDVARFSPRVASRGSLRAQLGINSQTVLFGFLGRFMEQKGFLPLLDSLAVLSGDAKLRGRFHVVAVGSGDFEREYRAEVQRRHMGNVVSFIPAVSSVDEILPDLDAVLMPSLWEACGLLAMEAMTAGIPVIGSDCIGLRDVLAGTPSRMVTTGDVPAWTAELRRFILCPDAQLAGEFAVEAHARFSAEKAAAQLGSVFESALRRQTAAYLVAPSVK